MTGREPQKQQQYYSSKVIWLLVILVGVALIVVGLTVISGDKYRAVEPGLNDNTSATDSLDGNDSLSVESISEPEPKPIPDLIEWRIYNEGINELAGENKFGMIYFTSEDCEPCRKMERETFGDLTLLARIDEFIVPVKIESESRRMISYSGRQISEAQAADIFNIPGYPALLFYDRKDERFLFTVPGFTSAEKLSRIFDYLQNREFEDPSRTLDEYLSAESNDA